MTEFDLSKLSYDQLNELMAAAHEAARERHRYGGRYFVAMAEVDRNIPTMDAPRLTGRWLIQGRSSRDIDPLVMVNSPADAREAVDVLDIAMEYIRGLATFEQGPMPMENSGRPGTRIASQTRFVVVPGTGVGSEVDAPYVQPKGESDDE